MAFTWNVSNPVALTSPGDQTNTEGDTVSQQIVGTDSTSGTLTYTAAGLPDGLSISDTGLISGTISAGTSTNSPFATTVTATDGTYTNSVAFNWNVSNPVTLTNPGDQSNTEGDTVSLPLNGTDATGGTLVYTVVGLPAGLTLDPHTGLISGTISAGTPLASPLSTTVSATDGTYSATQSFTWNVSNPITIANPGSQSGTEGDPVSLQIGAIDATGGTLSYSATGLPPGLSINVTTGLLTGVLNAGGSYPTTIAVTDGPYTATQPLTWTVSGPITITNPGDQSNTEGDTVSLPIAASDSSGGTLTYSATGLPAGLSIDVNSGLISGTVATGTAALGPYQTTVTVSDGPNTTNQPFTWNVSSPIAITPPGDQSNNEGDTVSLQISASDSSGGTLAYFAQGLPFGLSISPTTGLITGTIAAGAAAAGPYQPTLTVTDGTYTATQTLNWTVNVVGPITLTNPGDQWSNEGVSVSLTLHATDTTTGATLAYAAAGLPTGLTIDTSTGDITGTIPAGTSTDGPFTTTVTASDGTNNAAQTFTWNVNSSITLMNPGGQRNNEGDTVSSRMDATDTTTGDASSMPPWACQMA